MIVGGDRFGRVRIEALDIAGAWTCTPQSHPDDRGLFLEWFRADRLHEVTGRRFTAVQANHSVSRRGVVRGVHFVDVPPGQAKYVYCTRGAALDIVVDIRVGSPTYGAHSAVVLDDVTRRGVLLGEGLGHAFCALSEATDVTYLVTTAYDPRTEHAINPLDPDLALPWPDDVTLRQSDKDRAAPGLETARAQGLLPTYDACLAWYAEVSL
jgi:dTDP-4-dehydrorhamnose 3,5-epimerase